MTGYALTRARTSAGDLTVSLRSVNHRGLDLHFHHASEFAPFEAAMRALVKEGVGRGHVEIRATLSPAAEDPGASYDRAALKRYIDAFRQASRELQLEGAPDLNVLLTFPGVLGGMSGGLSDGKPLGAEFQAELLAVLSTCIAQLNEGREREGGELVASLARELAEIERAGLQMEALRIEALSFYHARLREKLNELLAGSSIPESRLAEEAAVLAERSDIEEELTRLAVHAKELRRIFELGGPLGKPVDFLLQEMNRETNTTLSKSSGAGELSLRIGSLALAVKANIERIREQALNLE
jgi:uncharacterized protein (TIGR00255 family)